MKLYDLDINKNLVTALIQFYVDMDFRRVPDSPESAADRRATLSLLGKLEKVMGGCDAHGKWGPYQQVVADAILSFEHGYEPEEFPDFAKDEPEGYPNILFEPNSKAVQSS